jgi:uncharacterized sporulation protein YeaH/YhbH (DUF444 family)
MVHRIQRDHQRFRDIIKGKIREDLDDYIEEGEFVGKQGDETVSVPIPNMNIPRFTFDDGEKGGVGQGEGEEGDPVDTEQGDGEMAGEAGQEPGDHEVEVDVSFDELADIMGEELELPNIEPKGNKQIETEQSEYTSISSTGPDSLHHFRRSYKEALKRMIASGEYDPEEEEDPVVVPTRDDMRYRARSTERQPETSALIVYMMDVSGSMGDEQKEIVRNEAFWIDVWLRSQYNKLDIRYIIHDAEAEEVDRETFFHVKESGGTKISSAYTLCRDLIDREYDAASWNIYPFHFSDGDNWGSEDTQLCMDLLRNDLLPISNQFSYGQVRSAYGSGQFKRDLDDRMKSEEKLITTEMEDRSDISDSIKTFLGTGN